MMLSTSKFTFVYFRAVFGVFAASMVALTLVCAMVSKMFATFTCLLVSLLVRLHAETPLDGMGTTAA